MAGTGSTLCVRLDLAAEARSVPIARDAVAASLRAECVHHTTVDDAVLAASELVSNAVLHGREPLTVSVLISPEGTIRVEVGDSSPVGPTFSALDPTAMTGRGLVLVAAVSDAWGVEPLAVGKVVWFELHADHDSAAARERASEDALLAAWGSDLSVDPAHEVVRVVLTDVDVPLTSQAVAHAEGLLREASWLTHAEAAPQGKVGRAISQAAAAGEAFDGIAIQLKSQLAAAMLAGRDQADLELSLARAEGEAVRDFSLALDALDRAARDGALLLAPPAEGVVRARRDLLARVLRGLVS